jgi:hypothetical protein
VEQEGEENRVYPALREGRERAAGGDQANEMLRHSL